MQNVVQVLEKQYLEERRTALEEQRRMYERELESLRQQLSPEKTKQHHQRSNSEHLAFTTHSPHNKPRLWTDDRWDTLTPPNQTHGNMKLNFRTSKTVHRVHKYISSHHF